MKGILNLPYSTLRSAWPALHNPANVSKAIPLSPKQFRYRFTNVLGEEESLEVYERYAIPGTGRLLFEAGLANFNPKSATKVDFRKDDRAIALAAGATPTTAAAWKTIPSWYLVARQDRTIDPVEERFMARRAGATTVEIDSSHVAMISHPGDVTDLIEEAARATG